MNSNAGKGQNLSRLSTKKRKDDKCAKCGCSYASDHLKDAEDLKKNFKEIHRLRKYLDFFEAMLTEMKRLNGDIQVTESEPLSIADHLKGLLCEMDKTARSGLPATESSVLYRKLCELIEKFSQLDNMVTKAETIFSGETVRNLTKLLHDCEKNMLGFQVSLTESQYIGDMEREFLQLTTINDKLCLVNESMCEQNKKLKEYQKIYKEKYVRLCNRLYRTEDLLIPVIKRRGLGKRRNSWFMIKRGKMNSNVRNGQNSSSRFSTRKRKDDECAKCGCSYASDLVNVAEDLKKKFKEIHRLRKYLNFFEAMLTEMKRLNGDIQVSESDPLSIVDHLKVALCDMDKVARSGLEATDSSALYRKLCELTDKFSQLDNMVNRAENVFSGKTVRNLTKFLDDCEKNMLGFQVGLKEFQYIGAREREIVKQETIIEKLYELNDCRKGFLNMYERDCYCFDRIEDLHIKKKSLRKRRNSW